MSARPADYDADPDRFLSSQRYPHDDVHSYVARRLVTLSLAADAAAWLRVHWLSAAAATRAAAALDLPLTLTVRGCAVYAIKRE